MIDNSLTHQFATNEKVVSVIITCKNRLSHLKQTLPKIYKQRHIEIIVVDYGCQEKTSEWLANNLPDVKVILVNDDPVFSLSRARNIGANNATGAYLMFSDADIFVELNIYEFIINNKFTKEFYSVYSQNDPSLCGTTIIKKDHFIEVGGYDEVFRGWGGEDVELYSRLKNRSFKHSFIKEGFSAIQHGDALRQVSVQSGGLGSKKKAMMASDLYIRILKDLFHYEKILNFKERMEVMQKVRNFISIDNSRGRVSKFNITFKIKSNLIPVVSISYKVKL